MWGGNVRSCLGVFDDTLRINGAREVLTTAHCFAFFFFFFSSFRPSSHEAFVSFLSRVCLQESCRKCHVQWKQHVGKTCEQVLERDEIRMRVLL